MTHSPEPWIVGAWDRIRVGGKEYYEFHTEPTDRWVEPAVWSGVEPGQRFHCSEWAPGTVVIDADSEYSALTRIMSQEDLDRILACVNFLQGIPTESLLLLMSDARWNDVLDDLHSAADDARRNPLPTEHP